MAEYSVTFARSARKELQALDSTIATRVLRRLEVLSISPRPIGVIKIEGADDLWRLRIGDWRVIYRISDREKLVDIIAIRHRKDAYR